MNLLQRKPPPLASERTVAGPNTDLDHLILRVMQGAAEPMEWTAHELVRATGARDRDVWRRLNLLYARGLVYRREAPDGPRRGPGSYLYSATHPSTHRTGSAIIDRY